MNKLFLNNTYNWEEIIKTPLSLEIARLKAPQLSDVTAADQIATALHEAIHLIYAVWMDVTVAFIAVSTRKSGSFYWGGGGEKSKGITCAYDYNEGFSTIYSVCAAAIFELELNNKDPNIHVYNEFKIAQNAAKYLDHSSHNNDKAAWEIVENVLNIMTSHEYSAEDGQLGSLWWLIRSVAIAALASRNSKTGEVSQENTLRIRRFVHRFCKSEKAGIGEYYPYDHLRVSMTQDIKWLRERLHYS